MTALRSFTSLLLANALLGACAVGPDFTAPAAPGVTRYTDTALPDKTASASTLAGAAQSFTDKGVPERWWTLFHSEALNTLVAQAVANNPDLKAADASLLEAQENYKAARSDLLPAIDGSFSPTREKFNPSAFGETGVPSSIFTLYNASVSVSYSLDVFGGSRRAIEQVSAESDYQMYEQRAAYLTLIANVVTAAIQEASLNEQVKQTQNIIDTESKQLDILRKQFEFGGIAKTSVLQQEAALAQTQASLPPLQKQLAQQHNALAVLTGALPANNTNAVFDLTTLTLPEELPVSLPSKLVESRPDILAATAQLHQASAGIGVATANMLPQFNLTGNYGFESTHLHNTLDASSSVWSFGADIVQPIFHGGALLHERRAAVAEYDKAAAQYESTVLLAFKNVADSLRALQFDADGLAAQSHAEAAAQSSLDLAQAQFRDGAISYPQLLDAQRTYQQTRIGLVQAQAARLADTAALFQSLGGSLQTADAAAASAQTPAAALPETTPAKITPPPSELPSITPQTAVPATPLLSVPPTEQKS